MESNSHKLANQITLFLTYIIYIYNYIYKTKEYTCFVKLSLSIYVRSKETIIHVQSYTRMQKFNKYIKEYK